MTTPITYPPGTISRWGTIQALDNQLAWITYVGVDGSIFYLAGPMAPVAGAQDGLVLKKHMGLMAPFEMLELRGARQDGATWTDAVYDVGDIMFSLEASGMGPQNIRDVIRYWISAWDPKRTGILSVFTPDLGEWWCNARLGKNISDQFEKDYTYSGKQTFTWNVKNYDAFWYGVDSVSESFGITYAGASEDFTAQSNASTLGGSWTQLYSATDAGTYGISNGAAFWDKSGVDDTVNFVNLYTTGSTTDNQVVSIQYSGRTLQNLFDMVHPGAANDIWVRCNAASTYAGITGVRLRLQLDTFKLSYFVSGTEVDWFTIPLIVPPRWGETFTLIAGTAKGKQNFVIQRGGRKIWEFNDWNGVSQVGSSYRKWGFGGHTNNIIGPGMIVPQPLAQWYAGDNLQASESGYVNLTNFGDLEAWPRYLCYGPGTFSFGIPGTSTAVTFGPIEEDQVVLVITDPRLRNIIDVSPNQQPQAVQNKWQSVLSGLISFATNNNTPPLLEQFESLFGILPPQGALYPLLNGRFTYSLPGASYGVLPTTVSIPVAITGASPQSGVVAAITPRRRWPL